MNALHAFHNRTEKPSRFISSSVYYHEVFFEKYTPSLRVGIPREHFLDLVDGEVRKAFDASLRILDGFGWRIEEVSIPNLGYALGAELAILSAEASSYHREMMRVHADDVSSDIRKELDSGMFIRQTSPDPRPCVFRVGSLKEDCRSACNSSGVTSMS